MVRFIMCKMVLYIMWRCTSAWNSHRIQSDRTPPHLLLTLASLIKTIPSPYTRQGQNLYEYAPLLHENPSQNSHIIKTSYYIMNQTTKGSTWWLSLNVYTMVDLLKQSFTKNIFRMRPYSHVTYRLEDAENHELQKSSRSDLSALMKKSLQQ